MGMMSAIGERRVRRSTGRNDHMREEGLQDAIGEANDVAIKDAEDVSQEEKRSRIGTVMKIVLGLMLLFAMPAILIIVLNIIMGPFVARWDEVSMALSYRS